MTIDRKERRHEFAQTPAASFRTGIGASDADSITLLGHDLATELLGKITFGELAYWLITNRRPSDGTTGDVRSGAGGARRPRLHTDRDRVAW